MSAWKRASQSLVRNTLGCFLWLFCAGFVALIGLFLGAQYDALYQDSDVGKTVGFFAFPFLCGSTRGASGFDANIRQVNRSFWITVFVSALIYYFLVPAVESLKKQSPNWDAFCFMGMIAIPFVVHFFAIEALKAADGILDHSNEDVLRGQTKGDFEELRGRHSDGAARSEEQNESPTTKTREGDGEGGVKRFHRIRDRLIRSPLAYLVPAYAIFCFSFTLIYIVNPHQHVSGFVTLSSLVLIFYGLRVAIRKISGQSYPLLCYPARFHFDAFLLGCYLALLLCAAINPFGILLKAVYSQQSASSKGLITEFCDFLALPVLLTFLPFYFALKNTFDKRRKRSLLAANQPIMSPTSPNVLQSNEGVTHSAATPPLPAHELPSIFSDD